MVPRIFLFCHDKHYRCPQYFCCFCSPYGAFFRPKVSFWLATTDKIDPSEMYYYHWLTTLENRYVLQCYWHA